MSGFTKKQLENIKKTGKSGYLQNEFFHTGYFHTGCDNELTERCKKIGKYVWAEEAKVYHDHPINDNFKEPLDDVYKLAYRDDRRKHDLALLKERAKKFGFAFKENFERPIKKVPIQSFQKMIEDGTNFSFTKIGDGEINCMQGVQGANCDDHPYGQKLGDALEDSFLYLSKLDRSYLGGWIDMMPNKDILKKFRINANYEMLIHTSITPEKYAFYNAVKQSKRKKIFIGPERLGEVKNFLNINQMIKVPLVNAFSYNFNLVPEKDAIYIFSAGMTSKVWITKLLRQNKEITCIDCGSAFDPLFYGVTRTRQIDIKILRDFYSELLPNTQL